MSNDHKTLADVQPGGRVRLGDGLPPLPRTHYNACGDGSEPLYTPEQMRDYARAAISAQPSPGGQGDAWDIAELVRTDLDRQSCPDAYMRIAMESVVKHLAARQPVETQLGYTLSDVHEAYSRGKRDAARQPVGEPDAWVPDKFFGPGVNAMTARRKPSDAAIAAHGLYVPLYRHPAPPAQAVDLGQFRPFVEAQRQEYISHGLTPEDYCVAKCDELLALIDGKAVGK